MNELTCVIIGGGHAGLHAFKAIKDKTRGMANGRRIRFVLFDKQPGHVRKVLLFRPAVSGEEIVVPWTRWSSEGIEFVQGAVTSIDSAEKQIRYTDGEGNEARAHYDLLVVAVGSIVRRPDPAQGGIALTDPQAAADIRERWLANLQKAARETSPEERKRLLTGVVAGAGISGIETSAELALAMREEAGAVTLTNSESLAVGLCVWTIGLIPNPALRSMGLPLTPEGQVLVDECYRVQGAPGVYSIGDCARIVDPRTGKADLMRCGDGVLQADRLGKIVMADLEGRPAPVHKSVPLDFFCIGLGENRGLVWGRKWGLTMMITGKPAWKFRNLAWDAGSMLR